jgi:hypothetical protein
MLELGGFERLHAFMAALGTEIKRPFMIDSNFARPSS